MKRIMAVVAVAVLVTAGCTPPPTISLTAPSTATCGGYMELEGVVDPPMAMTSVVLQRTTNGKWVDWLWYQTNDSDEDARKLVALVDPRTGVYSIRPRVPLNAGEVLSLRFRASAAAGGTKVLSPVRKVTVAKPAGRSCPTSLSPS